MASALKQRDLFTRRWRGVEVPVKEATSLHIPLVQALRWCVRPDVIWRHVPNGEYRDRRTAAKLKAMGVLAGSSDLEFHFCETVAGVKTRRMLHLELKVGNRPQSEAQAGFALAMLTLGDEYFIARTIDEALAILKNRGLLRRDVRL